MDKNDLIEAAEKEYRLALDKIYNKGKGLTMSEGGAGAEARYSAAYARLVALGVARPLRGKYRKS